MTGSNAGRTPVPRPSHGFAPPVTAVLCRTTGDSVAATCTSSMTDPPPRCRVRHRQRRRRQHGDRCRLDRPTGPAQEFDGVHGMRSAKDRAGVGWEHRVVCAPEHRAVAYGENRELRVQPDDDKRTCCVSTHHDQREARAQLSQNVLDSANVSRSSFGLPCPGCFVHVSRWIVVEEANCSGRRVARCSGGLGRQAREGVFPPRMRG